MNYYTKLFKRKSQIIKVNLFVVKEVENLLLNENRFIKTQKKFKSIRQIF